MGGARGGGGEENSLFGPANIPNNQLKRIFGCVMMSEKKLDKNAIIVGAGVYSIRVNPRWGRASGLNSIQCGAEGE